jgi:hypothetical protein
MSGDASHQGYQKSNSTPIYTQNAKNMEKKLTDMRKRDYPTSYSKVNVYA